MAIRFTFKSLPRSTRQKTVAGEGAANSVSALGAKAADMVERARLMHAIFDLEDEIALQMCAIGEMVYATHKGRPSDSGELQKILEYVDDLEDEIAGHEEQLKLLQGVKPCPVCDEDISEDDVFCQKCGTPLPTPIPEES